MRKFTTLILSLLMLAVAWPLGAMAQEEEEPVIYSSEIKSIHHDIEKKANLAMNIMMNAFEKKFDVKHEYKVF